MGLGIRARLRKLRLYPELSDRTGVGTWFRNEATALGKRLVGMQDIVDPSDSLAIDLARLSHVTRLLGREVEPPARDRRQMIKQRQRISHYLGERLTECTARERETVVQAFARADNELPPEVQSLRSRDMWSEGDTIRENGCVGLGRTLDDAQIASIHAHLRTKPLLLGHDAHTTKNRVASLADVPAEQSFACYDYLDLWSSPHIIELATQDRVLDIAQAYLGCTPTLYSINAFWSLPNRQLHPYAQLFHRDWEDFRSFVVFTQLTPVDEPQEGAHYYVEESHEYDRFEASLARSGVDGASIKVLMEKDPVAIADIADGRFSRTARRFDGPAGQSFCTDGFGLHRAVVPRSKPRLLMWMRFGNFFNEKMYDFAPHIRDRVAARKVLERIPATARHRYAFRHMAEALSAI